MCSINKFDIIKSVKERLEILDNSVNKHEDLFRLHPVLREAGFGSKQDGYGEQN